MLPRRERMKGQAEGRTNEKDKPIAVPIDDPTRKPVLPIFALFCAILRQKNFKNYQTNPFAKIQNTCKHSDLSTFLAARPQKRTHFTDHTEKKGAVPLNSAFCLPPPPRRAEVQRRRIAFST